MFTSLASEAQSNQPSPNARVVVLKERSKRVSDGKPKGPIFADIDCLYDNGYLYFDFQRPEYSMMKI